MVKKFSLKVLLLFVLLIAVACSNSDDTTSSDSGETTSDENGVEVITLKALGRGAEETRLSNLQKAAEVLNKELEAEGKRIEIETSFFDGSEDDYARQFILAHQSGDAPDIYSTSHPNIGWLVEGDYILPLDELKEMDSYKDVYPLLWDAVTYNGHIWAALQDTEARPVYYSKNILREIGWSDEEIESLPEKVREGEFTLDDLMDTAEEAMEKGAAKYGIIHRPVVGPDFQLMLYLFGGTMYDHNEGKLVFDKPAVKKQLEFYHEISERGLIPDGLLGMEWTNTHQMVVNEETLFYFGGIWNVFNWSEDEFHKELGKVDGEWVEENLGMMLVPAPEKGGEPKTLSQPYTYTISSQTEHKDLILRLLEIVIEPEYQTVHNIETFHLPVTESAAEDPEYKEHVTLGKVSYMSEYTSFLPNHPDFPKYNNAVFSIIEQIELKGMDPDTALAELEKQLNNDLGGNFIIKE